MRLGADASHLRWKRTGVSRYADELLHAMTRLLQAGDTVCVYYNARPGSPLFDGAAEERFVRMPRATAWNQVALPLAVSRDRCDVFLGAANVIPLLGRFAKVVVIHDCLPFRDPAAKPGLDGAYLRTWMLLAARHASRVVSVSGWAAAECERFLAPRHPVDVVHPGVSPFFTPAEDIEAERAALRAATGVPAPFVLQVGGGRHKGEDVAAGGVAELRRRGHDVALVRCGDEPPGGDDAVFHLGRVDDVTLRALYRAAVAVCVASSHEGFGLPVLEAFACGTPAVVARAGGLAEAGGDAAVFFEPGDVPGLADALEVALDPGRRAPLAAAGLAQAGRFSWEGSAARMLQIVSEAAAA